MFNALSPRDGRRRRLGRAFFAVIFAAVMLTAVALLAVQSTALAADPPNQPFDLIYTAENVKYRVYQDGVGTLGTDTGTLTNVVTINGTSIKAAYLVWAGLGRDDDGVLLQREGSGQAPQQIIAPAQYTWNKDRYGGANTWGCCGGELSVYAADITATGIAATGTFSYTVSDMEIQHVNQQGQTVEENWGFSLILIYEDPTLTSERDIIIKLGNDGLFTNWTGLVGPNSDVQCVAFSGQPFGRTASFSIVVGGTENDYRPNALWGRSGSDGTVNPAEKGGTWTDNVGLINLPPNISGVGTQLDGPTFRFDPDLGQDRWFYPFADRNGDEWDEYPPRPAGDFDEIEVLRQPYLNVPIVGGESWSCLQVESASQANRPELPDPVQSAIPNENRPASIGFMGFILVLRDPAIEIVKYTNGEDANDPDGAGVPVIAAGDTVTWTYAVTNTGAVTIAGSDITVTDDVVGAITQIVDDGDGDDLLAPGESWLYQKTGLAVDLGAPGAAEGLVLVENVCTQGQAGLPPSTAYTNIGTVEIPGATDSDPSSYCGPPPETGITIIKFTNGQDANDPDSEGVPIIEPGDPVTWTYRITNTGPVAIPESDITVTDNVIGAIATIVNKGDGDTDLAPNESWVYQATGTAIDLANPPDNSNLVLVSNVCSQDGAVLPSTAYTNVGTVTIPDATASDPSSYCGPRVPLVSIVKFTNGQDANDPNGTDVPVVAAGDPVTWTYRVTNIGTVDILEADISVTDNVLGAITQIIDKGDGNTTLVPNEVWVYQATGTAIDLSNPPDNPNLVLVPNVCARGNLEAARSAYTNEGTVTIPTMSDNDPSSYCNPPPTALVETEEPADTMYRIFIPLLAR